MIARTSKLYAYSGFNQKKPAELTNRYKTIAMVASPIVLALCFLVGARLLQFRYGYEIAKLEAKQMSLYQKQREFELEMALLKRPERLRNIATKELGLATPEPRQMIYLNKRTRR